MKITVVPSAYTNAGVTLTQHLTSYLINDTVAIDAGAIGFYRSHAEQADIRHIFLTHSHMDHLASLPTFLENTIGLCATPVVVHASDVVQEVLRHDIFNGRVWPNFLALKFNNQPFVSLQPLQSGVSVEVEGLRITPIAVDHAVPTLGFIIEDDATAVVIPSDTAPTHEIWARASQTPNLKAVFLEAAFPNHLAWLAGVSKHLTSADFAVELKKLTVPATFYAVHLKAQYREQITHELLELRLPNVEVARFGVAYDF